MKLFNVNICYVLLIEKPTVSNCCLPLRSLSHNIEDYQRLVMIFIFNKYYNQRLIKSIN